MQRMSLHDVQNALLEIMTQFDAFCVKYGLRYYLCGGALIGAIRHKGFIPWDDDIDVLMPRPDYNALIERCRTEKVAEDLQLFHYKLGNSKLLFMKLADMRTWVENPYQIEEEHVSLDIFPLDGMSDDEKENHKSYRKIQWMRSIQSLHRWRIGKATSLKICVLKLLAYPWAMLVKDKWLCMKIDSLAGKNSFDNARLIGDIIWGYGEVEIVEKECFLKQVKVPFEDRYFQTTAMYDAYLRNIYGDYMQLPPENKRAGHRTIAYRK